MPLLFILKTKVKNYHAKSQNASAAAQVTHFVRAGGEALNPAAAPRSA
jgi:hypothetical protein